MINKGVEINAVNSKGENIFKFAVINGNVDVLELLIKNNVKPTTDKLGNNCFHDFTKSNSIKIIHKLVDLFTSESELQTEIDWLNHSGITPLIQCLMDNNMKDDMKEGIVTALINSGASLETKNKNGYTLMHLIATNNKYKKWIGFLLIKKPHLDLNILNESKDTPLMIGAAKGQIDICKVLLKHGAKINVINSKGFNALYIAIFNEELEMTNELLKFSIVNKIHIIDTKTSEEKSPLRLALEKNNKEITKMLLTYKPTISNIDLMFAKENRNEIYNDLLSDKETLEVKGEDNGEPSFGKSYSSIKQPKIKKVKTLKKAKEKSITAITQQEKSAKPFIPQNINLEPKRSKKNSKDEQINAKKISESLEKIRNDEIKAMKEQIKQKENRQLKEEASKLMSKEKSQLQVSEDYNAYLQLIEETKNELVKTIDPYPVILNRGSVDHETGRPAFKIAEKEDKVLVFIGGSEKDSKFMSFSELSIKPKVEFSKQTLGEKEENKKSLSLKLSKEENKITIFDKFDFVNKKDLKGKWLCDFNLELNDKIFISKLVDAKHLNDLYPEKNILQLRKEKVISEQSTIEQKSEASNLSIQKMSMSEYIASEDDLDICFDLEQAASKKINVTEKSQLVTSEFQNFGINIMSTPSIISLEDKVDSEIFSSQKFEDLTISFSKSAENISSLEENNEQLVKESNLQEENSTQENAPEEKLKIASL